VSAQQNVALKFLLGRVTATPAVLDQVPADEILLALTRHARGDWGELDSEDLKANEDSLREGGRLVSSYVSTAGVKFLIITEWNRKLTTVLLPEDY